MTQETEIPEDVLDTVNELWHERLHSAHANDGLGSGEIMAALAVAILAERDACARRYREGASPNTWDYFKEAEDAINPPR